MTPTVVGQPILLKGNLDASWDIPDCISKTQPLILNPRESFSCSDRAVEKQRNRAKTGMREGFENCQESLLLDGLAGIDAHPRQLLCLSC